MKATIREISRQTGFSPATVSNALSGKRNVNAETSRQIRKAADELGYFEAGPVSAARTKIHLVFFQADGKTAENTSAFSSLIKGVEQESDRLGYEVTFHYLERMSSSFERQVKMLEESSGAVVLVGNDLTEEDYTCFASITGPAVLIGYWKPGMRQSAVLPDYELTASLAIDYLTRKGHKRIGHLQNRRRSAVATAQEYWYKQELKQKDLSFEPADTVTLDPGLESSYRGMLQFLEQQKELPSAYVADSDEIALGVMKALQEKGFRIPDDISVIGFGDLPFAQIVSPRLTTISFSYEEIGIQAVKTLASLIGQPDASQVRVMVTPRLAERESVRNMNV